MKLQFLGAAGMVTGSSYLLSDGKGDLLIDLGMFQGSQEMQALNSRPLAFAVDALAGVVLTHAHLDHCGRLPLLIKAGFSGPIYTTEASAQLLELSLYDTAKINKEREGEVLFGEKEVEQLMKLVKIADYHTPFKVGNFTIEMYEAGHILGSTSLLVTTEKGKRLIFSGDLGNTPQDLIKPTEYFDRGEVVVMESTYGDRIHGGDNPIEVLAREVQAVEQSGGTLLIPSFSLERTQELLHRFDHLKREKKIKEETAFFLDSPMAQKATNIFRGFPELYNNELSDHVRSDDPFSFPGLVMVENYKASQEIVNELRPKVILAGSGMMTGGRILNHARIHLGNDKNRILFVGFQAEGTIGRRIKDGERKIRIDGEEVEIHATVSETSAISAHADQPRLVNWLSKIEGVEKLFLTHGEDLSRLSLKEKIHQEMGLSEIELPKLNQQVEIE